MTSLVPKTAVTPALLGKTSALLDVRQQKGDDWRWITCGVTQGLDVFLAVSFGKTPTVQACEFYFQSQKQKVHSNVSLSLCEDSCEELTDGN